MTRARTTHIARFVAPALLALGAAVLPAQESLLPSASWGLAPVVTAWHFSTPLAQSAGGVTDVQQFALPLRARAVFNERWTFDVTGAAARTSVSTKNGDSTQSLTLSGLTDVKLRMSGSFNDDRLLLTGGLNLPTGTTGLNGEQTDVLQVIGAPALGMPVNALGIGTGVTLGAVQAIESGDWSFALGGSVEQRTEYTPIALALASGQSLTKVTPGTAVHLSLGSDRPVGDNRLAMLVVADVFSKDKLLLTTPDATNTSSDYTLGPQVTGLARYDLAVPGWRSASGTMSLRYRSAFTDQSGSKVSGSAGSYLEGSLQGIRGGSIGTGLILGVDARYHTGLSFTDALVGTAVRAGGVTLGVDLPSRTLVSRIALHGQYGQFNTGTSSTNGMGLSLVWAIAARQEAR
ncbi:MAG TPA: hypothetical protein VN706_21465 [Gemmatimonadaceae bacterium]|nr:hypothetical protein [Gemmatimonadaceae bacterium]